MKFKHLNVSYVPIKIEMIKIIVSAKMDSMIIVQPPANPANIHAKIVLVQVLVYLV